MNYYYNGELVSIIDSVSSDVLINYGGPLWVKLKELHAKV